MEYIQILCILTNKYKLRLEETGDKPYIILLYLRESTTSGNHTGKVGRRQENKARRWWLVKPMWEKTTTFPLK